MYSPAANNTVLKIGGPRQLSPEEVVRIFEKVQEREFSIEYIPVRDLQRQKDEAPINFVIEDSTEGWAESLRTGMEAWFNGNDIHFNYSLSR